jgi:hypothetical protein
VAIVSKRVQFKSEKKIRLMLITLPIPVAARSKAWVCDRSLAGIVGLNPAECCVSSGRGLCVRLITRPEESYRVW